MIPLVHMIFVVSYNNVTVKLIIIVFFLIKVFEVREVYKLTGELQIPVSAKISKVTVVLLTNKLIYCPYTTESVFLSNITSNFLGGCRFVVSQVSGFGSVEEYCGKLICSLLNE